MFSFIKKKEEIFLLMFYKFAFKKPIISSICVLILAPIFMLLTITIITTVGILPIALLVALA
ncbi:MAG: hypothetical protein RR073_04260 [Clostridia bacterium]